MEKSRVLIVYASRYGQTAKVAERIASVLRPTLEVDLLTPDRIGQNLHSSRYAAALVGGSVYFGRHQKAIRRFVRRQAKFLAAVPSAFFSVSGAGGAPTKEGQATARGYVDTFIAETGWQPAAVAIFGGGTPYSKYGWFMRWFMTRDARKRGRIDDPSRDYEYTDWDAVERFAREFVSRIPD